MSITPTIADGFYVTHSRHGIRMSRRCLSKKHAEECLRNMIEDVVVDLPRMRYYFHRDKIIILKKPNLTDPKYKCAYEDTLFFADS
jgi:hypothetical protein